MTVEALSVEEKVMELIRDLEERIKVRAATLMEELERDSWKLLESLTEGPSSPANERRETREGG